MLEVGTDPTPVVCWQPGEGQRWEVGVERERGLWAGAGNTQVAQLGSRFWFSESGD